MLSFPTAPVSHRFSLKFLYQEFLLLFHKTLAKHNKGYEKSRRPWCQNPRQLVEEQRSWHLRRKALACRVLLQGRIRPARPVHL